MNLANDFVNKEIVEHSSVSENNAATASPVIHKSSAGMLAFVFIAVLISLLAGAFSFFLFQQLEQNKNQLSELKLEIGGQLTGKLDGVSGKFNSVTDRFSSVSDRISKFNGNISKINSDVQQLDGLVKQEFKQLDGLFKEHLQQQQKNTSAQQTTLSQLDKDIQQSLRAQQISNEQITHSIDKLYKQKGRTRNDWILSEVEYLLLIANHGLNLSFDVNTAIIALQSADERLLDMGDPGIIPIRKFIAQELIELKAVPSVDITGMQAVLSALIKQAINLPVLNSETPTVDNLIQSNKDKEAVAKVANATPSTIDKYKESLKQVTDKFLNELKSLVVYRNKKIAATELIAPEQKFFLQQHLSLKLESARKALLDGRDTLFQSLLAETQELLTQYFDAQKQSVKSFSQQLTQLQSKKIIRQLPDISSSVNELKKYVLKLEQQRKENNTTVENN